MVDGAEVVAKEEELVLDDRAADAAAEVVIREMAEGGGGEEGAGVDGVVLDELEGRAVKGVGSGFEGDVSDRTDGAAEFGFEVVGGDVDGLDGFGGRDDDLQQAGAFVVVDALDLVEVSHARDAVGFGLKGTLGIEELRVLEGGGGRSGDEVEKRLEVAIGAEGKVCDLLGFDLSADIGAVGLEQRWGGGDKDGFCNAAGYKSDVDAGGGVAEEIDVLVAVTFEAGCFYGHSVGAGLEARERVVSALIRDGLLRDAGCRFRDRDMSVRDGSTGVVGNVAEKGAVNCLRVQQRGWRQKEGGEEAERGRSAESETMGH